MNIFYAINYKDHISLSVDTDTVKVLIGYAEAKIKQAVDDCQFDRARDLLEERRKLLGALEEETDE